MIPPPRHVQVLRALKVGDMLCAVPALRAMRRAWPHTRIKLIGLPWARAFVERLPGYVDDLLEFPGWPGVPERDAHVADVVAFLERVNADPPDLAIQLHGSGVATNAFVAMLGARRTAGTVVPGMFAPDPGTFVPFDPSLSEVHRALAVVERLGVPPAGEHLELLVLDEDRAEIAAGPARALVSSDYAIVHPGASVASRRWSAASFGRVTRALAERMPVIVTGTASERSIGAEVAAAADHADVAEVAGRTSFGGLAALVAGARVVVSSDTGVAHVADALGTPSVVVFTGSETARWAPADRALHRVVARAPSNDVSGARAGRGNGNAVAPRAVEPDAVIDAALDLLFGHAVGAA